MEIKDGGSGGMVARGKKSLNKGIEGRTGRYTQERSTSADRERERRKGVINVN